MEVELLVALLCIVIVIVIYRGRDKHQKPVRTFNPIVDNFKTLEQVQTALRGAGLEAIATSTLGLRNCLLMLDT